MHEAADSVDGSVVEKEGCQGLPGVGGLGGGVESGSRGGVDGIQNGLAAEHSSDKPAVPGPACGARDDTLPKRAFIPFPHNDSGLSECETPVASRADSRAETPIAPTQRPNTARKVRNVVRREDILEELHVAVRLREAPLPRGQKLQSSWD